MLPSPTQLKTLKMLVLDVDGVLTDGTIYLGTGGIELKGFNIKDGLGLKLLQDNHVSVAIITGRRSEAVTQRASELGIALLVDKCDDKLSALRTLARQQGIELEQIAYIGDDLPDIPPMEVCGLAIAVADAHPKVKQIAQWVTTLKGGQGAVREVCDAILEHLASF